jgi:hypothetical protein
MVPRGRIGRREAAALAIVPDARKLVKTGRSGDQRAKKCSPNHAQTVNTAIRPERVDMARLTTSRNGGTPERLNELASSSPPNARRQRT